MTSRLMYMIYLWFYSLCILVCNVIAFGLVLTYGYDILIWIIFGEFIT